MLLAFLITYAMFGLMFAIAIITLMYTDREKFRSVITDSNRAIITVMLLVLSVFIWPYFLWKARQ